MKVAMFRYNPSEEPYMKAWEEKTGDTLVRIKGNLSMKNVDQAKGCDAMCTKQSINITDEAIYRRLHEFGIKQISMRSVGFNTVDWKLIKKYHFIVTNTPAYSPRAIAENGLTQVMFLLRKTGYFRELAKKGDFSRPANLVSDEIYHKTVGIIGLGHIGTASAQIYSALGAKVIGYDPVYNESIESFVKHVSLDTVFHESDIITIHTPLDESTKNMIGMNEFKKMKNSVIFCNQARGGCVVTQDLINALKDHEIAGAALDVLADEGSYYGLKVDRKDLPEDYLELEKMPNVIMTPHSAYFTATAVRNMINTSLIDIRRILEGKKPHNLVLEP